MVKNHSKYKKNAIVQFAIVFFRVARSERYNHELAGDDTEVDDDEDALFASFSSCSPRYSKVSRGIREVSRLPFDALLKCCHLLGKVNIGYSLHLDPKMLKLLVNCWWVCWVVYRLAWAFVEYQYRAELPQHNSFAFTLKMVPVRPCPFSHAEVQKWDHPKFKIFL